MKTLLFSIIIVHGLIHLLGFVKEWNLASVSQLSGSTFLSVNKGYAHITGIIWLVVCLLLLCAATFYLRGKEFWWALALPGVLASQALILMYWHDARWGTIANLIILAAAIVAYADWKFSSKVQDQVHEMFATSPPGGDDVIITEAMLKGLPEPVQLWLAASGIVGKKKTFAVRLKQKGLMRTKPEQDKWVEATAEQYVTINRPAYIWKVKMNILPLMPVTGRDKWINGKGQMQIKLLSLISMVNVGDEKIDQGALQRYLAEMCWFPSAALSPYIRWEAVDSTSARAIMTYKGVSGAVLFQINDRGEVTGCYANRYMGGGKEAVLEKWEVRSTEYAVMDGIKIPVKSEATWKLKTGDFTWYKLQITQIEYNHLTLY